MECKWISVCLYAFVWINVDQVHFSTNEVHGLRFLEYSHYSEYSWTWNAVTAPLQSMALLLLWNENIDGEKENDARPLRIILKIGTFKLKLGLWRIFCIKWFRWILFPSFLTVMWNVVHVPFGKCSCKRHFTFANFSHSGCLMLSNASCIVVMPESLEWPNT